MGHLESHKHTYQVVREYLTPRQMAELIWKIDRSRTFENSQFSHICIKGTDICVGYLGDESADMVDVHRKDARHARRELRNYFFRV